MVSRPVEEVFAYVTEVRNLPAWWPRVLRVEGVSDTPMVEGGIWTKVLEAGSGRRLRLDYTCVEMGAPSLIAWTHELRDTGLENHLRSQSTRIELTGIEGGTEVRITADADLKGTAKLVSPAMKKEQRRMVEGAISGLTDALGESTEGA